MKRTAWLFLATLFFSLFLQVVPASAIHLLNRDGEEVPDICFSNPGDCNFRYHDGQIGPTDGIEAWDPDTNEYEFFEFLEYDDTDDRYYFVGDGSFHYITVKACSESDFRTGQMTEGDTLHRTYGSTVTIQGTPLGNMEVHECDGGGGGGGGDSNDIQFIFRVTDIPEGTKYVVYVFTLQLFRGGPGGVELGGDLDDELRRKTIGASVEGQTTLQREYLLQDDFYNIEEGEQYAVCLPELKDLDDGGCTETRRKDSSRLDLVYELTAEEANVLANSAEPTPEPSCSGLAFFASIACAMIQGLYNFLHFVYENGVVDNLHVDPLRGLQGDEQDRTLYTIWNNFRVIANILFIIVFLLAIFGQAFSFMFSAYELKKIMPRLVIGVIGVQLSWYIVGFLVDVFNILGAGMRSLILAPVDGLTTFQLDTHAIDASFIGVLLGGGALALGKFTFAIKGLLLFLPPLLLSLALIVIVALVVVVFRKILILVLIITAPVAIVTWILPNTERFAKTWWDFLIKALIMYPLIVGLIAAGELLAKLLVTGDDPSTVSQIAGIVAVFAPFVLIPQTFKFAGNVIANVASGFDRARKMAGAKSFGDVRNPFSYRGRRREYIQQGLQQGAAQFVDTHRGGFNVKQPRTWRNALAMGYARIAPGVDETIARRNKEAFEWAERSGSYDAGTLFAQLGTTKNLFTGSDLDPLYVNEAQAHLNDMSRTAAAMAILINKAGSIDEVDKIRHTLVNNKHFSPEQKDRIWQTVTIADMVKNVHGDLRYRDWAQPMLRPDGSMNPSSIKSSKALEFIRKTVDQEPDYAIKNQRASFWYGHMQAKQQIGSLPQDERQRAVRNYDRFYEKIRGDFNGKKQMILNSDFAQTDLETVAHDLTGAGQLDLGGENFGDYRQHRRNRIADLRGEIASRGDAMPPDERNRLQGEIDTIRQDLATKETAVLEAFARKKGFYDADHMAVMQYESRQPAAAREALWRYLRDGDTAGRMREDAQPNAAM